MKKIIITLTVLLCGILSANAQELKPHFVKRAKAIIAERTEHMDLNKEQVKALTKKQNEHFMNIQKLHDKYGAGSEEFKTEIKVIQKSYNKFIVEFSTPEQRKKWNEYTKSKK
ncbi:hypothetical protein [Ochrovirga pacifica]|uniref:hypothetical protein n=1 Tax=Ochrovirga pacifica TaxID=1042376 RepID=UPI000255A548|nr:hypothetical protein [Ochrovirga pacifica]